MRLVLILSQHSEKNKSVKILEKSLEKVQGRGVTFRVVVLELLETDNVFMKDGFFFVYRKEDSGEKIEFQLSISDISLVIKRTWGPVRYKALEICRLLEEVGVCVMNGFLFMEFSYSKLRQHQYPLLLNFFPKHIIFDTAELSAARNDLDIGIASLAEKVSGTFNYPIIVKLSESCLARGVFYVKKRESFCQLMRFLLQEKFSQASRGLLIEEFVPTNEDPYISEYYRANFVDQCLQSAMRFQSRWEDMGEIDGILMLKSFGKAVDLPFPIQLLEDIPEIQAIGQCCPHSPSVVGIDFLWPGRLRFYLLELNSGPTLQLIESPESTAGLFSGADRAALKACQSFPDAVSEACFRVIARFNEDQKVDSFKLVV